MPQPKSRSEISYEMAEELPLSQIDQYPLLNQIFTWWQSCETLPSRKDVDPLTLPPQVLPRIFLFDVDGDRLFIRLAGTLICQEMGWDPTARYLDEVYNPVTDYGPDVWRAMKASSDACIANRTPSLAIRDLRTARKDQFRYVRLLIPLSEDRGLTVTGLMAASIVVTQEKVHRALEQSALREVLP